MKLGCCPMGYFELVCILWTSEQNVILCLSYLSCVSLETKDEEKGMVTLTALMTHSQTLNSCITQDSLWETKLTPGILGRKDFNRGNQLLMKTWKSERVTIRSHFRSNWVQEKSPIATILELGSGDEEMTGMVNACQTHLEHFSSEDLWDPLLERLSS